MLNREPDLEKEQEPRLSLKVTKPCSSCGSVAILYQQNLCKVCLTKSFKKLVKMIDSVRN